MSALNANCVALQLLGCPLLNQGTYPIEANILLHLQAVHVNYPYESDA